MPQGPRNAALNQFPVNRLFRYDRNRDGQLSQEEIQIGFAHAPHRDKIALNYLNHVVINQDQFGIGGDKMLSFEELTQTFGTQLNLVD